VESFFVATILLLIGAVRAWDKFIAHDLKTFLYVGGLAAADIALLILYLRSERRAQSIKRM
jgi:hypothetical protein